VKEKDLQRVSEEAQRELQGLEKADDAENIRLTRQRLEGLNYVPTLIIPTPGFLSFSSFDLANEIKRVAALTDQEMVAENFEKGSDFADLKARHISLLLYHFKLLVRLRRDEPDAWDEVDELFTDD